MSEMSEKARSDAKDKVKRLTEKSKDAVDASGWTEDEYGSGMMHNEKKLGNRPISKQNLACGGKAAHKHSGRKSRDMGGPMSNAGANYVANVPAPPQNRFSFTGNPSPILGAAGMNKGGRTKRADGGQAAEVEGKRPMGGRMARASGGSTKKGTTVNIVIAQKPEHQMMPGGAPSGAGMPKPPMPMPPPSAPAPMAGPQGAPAGPMPGGPNMPPPSMQPPVGRKDGGKVYPDMKFSAANGKGRLEKARKYCD